MRIIVVGCGKVGRTIVERLSGEGHDIAVIDTDSDVITDVTDNFDVMGVVGNGASYSVLKEAGIEDTNLLGTPCTTTRLGTSGRNLACP